MWNNDIVAGNPQIALNSKILKTAGFTQVRAVVKNGSVMPFQEIANVCKIRHINSGRIASTLREKLDVAIRSENGQGPMNHVGNRMVVPSCKQNDELITLSETSVKENYKRIISRKQASPNSQNKWQEVWHLSRM